MRSFSKALIVTAMVMMIIASSSAQSPQKYRTEIPFDFVVDGHKLPAGNYNIAIDSVLRLVTFSAVGKQDSAVAAYRMSDLKSTSKNLQLKFDADNSFEGFRGLEDGGTVWSRTQRTLAKNGKTAGAGKGSAD